MFTNYKIYIVLYILLTVFLNYNYKISTSHMKSSATLTIILGFIASIVCIILIPFFNFNFPKIWSIYIFLFTSIIFYTLHNRFSTISRSGCEVSTYTILKQLPSVFMILIGILLFKEPFILKKIIGALLIFFSNILVFYKKGVLKIDKYVLYGVIANVCMTIAMVIDINLSEYFNLAMYVLFIVLIPSIIIMLVEKVKISDIVLEYKLQNKLSLFITGICFSLMTIVKIQSYKYGTAIKVAPLSSLSVIFSIILGYILLNEKDNIFRKIIASILILIGVFLINI